MGWTFTYKRQGQSVLDFFRHQFEDDGSSGRILDGAAFIGQAYLAWERPDGTVYGIVCLLRHAPRDPYNFGYKEMSEDMGPSVNRCPQRILDLLTPTEHPYALQWRERCRAYLRRLEERQLKKGDIIRFSEPLCFASGEELDLFRYEPQKHRRLFRAFQTDRIYRIPDYKDRAWQRITIVASSVSAHQHPFREKAESVLAAALLEARGEGCSPVVSHQSPPGGCEGEGMLHTGEGTMKQGESEVESGSSLGGDERNIQSASRIVSIVQ